MKKIIIVIVVLLGAGFVYHSKAKQRILADKTKNEEIAKANAIKAATHSLAEKHHAVIDWTKSLKHSGIDEQDIKWSDFSECYSLEMETALTQNNNPILLETELADILKRGKSYYVVFSITGILTGIRFELEASPDQIKSLLAKPRPFIASRYAVVASIKSAYRPAIEIAKVNPSETDEIKIETESDFIIAKGKLLDYVCLEEL